MQSGVSVYNSSACGGGKMYEIDELFQEIKNKT